MTSGRTLQRGHHPPILAKAGEEPCIMPNHGFPLGVDIDLPDRIKEQKLPTNPAPCWSYTPTV